MADAVRRPVTPARVLAVRPDHRAELPDDLATEEPMEIRVSPPGRPAATVSVTMRTPGNDFELAAGFLVTEGVVEPEDIAAIRYCELPDGAEQKFNTVTVNLRRPIEVTPRRSHTVSSACGVCGTGSIDDLAARLPPLPAGPPLRRSVLVSLPERLREAQRVFSRTGGLHAAGVFTTEGVALVAREDIGRHNAVDKVIGWAALAGRLPLAGHALMVSGRVGFEIAQKAAAAGIPVVAAVSAPSSLAVATAAQLGVTVVGFLRGNAFNVYSHPERIDLAG